MGIALGHKDHHPLPGAGQQHTIGVADVIGAANAFGLAMNGLPARAAKAPRLPTIRAPQVEIPSHAGPIEFKPRNIEFDRGIPFAVAQAKKFAILRRCI
jgi:hypothetical protein